MDSLESTLTDIANKLPSAKRLDDVDDLFLIEMAITDTAGFETFLISRDSELNEVSGNMRNLFDRLHRFQVIWRFFSDIAHDGLIPYLLKISEAQRDMLCNVLSDFDQPLAELVSHAKQSIGESILLGTTPDDITNAQLELFENQIEILRPSSLLKLLNQWRSYLLDIQ